MKSIEWRNYFERCEPDWGSLPGLLRHQWTSPRVRPYHQAWHSEGGSAVQGAQWSCKRGVTQWERGTTQWKLAAIGQITAPRQRNSSSKTCSLLSPASFIDNPRWKPEGTEAAVMQLSGRDHLPGVLSGAEKCVQDFFHLQGLQALRLWCTRFS